jgi:hypothetical protein
MKKIYLFFILLSLTFLSAQTKTNHVFNGYRNVLMPNIANSDESNMIAIKNSDLQFTAEYIKSIGLNTINDIGELGNDSDICETLELKINAEMGFWINIGFEFINCKGKKVYASNAKLADFGEGGGTLRGLQRATKKILGPINKGYNFDETVSPMSDKKLILNVENINTDEDELKSLFETVKLDPIEGIYKSYKSNSNFKIGIMKTGDKYKAIILESDIPNWKKGDVKIIFETTAAEGAYTIKNYSNDKTAIQEGFANLEGALIAIDISNNEPFYFLKIYPKK